MNNDARRQTIMIVENDRTVLELLQIRLDVAGYHTCMARNGTMAAETLRNFRPAGLMINLRLPDISALEVLREFNPHEEKLPFPTLLMAKNPDKEDVRAALRLGVRDILIMPFSGADAVDRVARLLRPPATPQTRAPIMLNA
jgi:DNA-binding response OmpR family regulator